jgi:glycosyltransferase involved in cell wall biosynthesis
LCGRLPDAELASMVRSADAVVTLSTHEAQGIVLLEALAAGTGVVASDIAAHADVAIDSSGAVRLVPVDADASVVAGAVESVAARRWPERPVPSWSDVAARTGDLYRAVLREVAA